MKQDKIINLTEFRLSRQAQNNEQKIKINAFEKIEENKQSDSAKFNYEFYCLVDLFLRETYPDYAWRFNIWLEKIK